MVNENIIDQAVNELLVAAPGSKVILFGSWARGDAKPDSDVDLLVIQQNVPDRHAEMTRLARLLGEKLIPADVVVLSQDQYDHWKDTPNTLAWRAAQEGIIYERVA
ncbi:nucleotidyltransferase domain-containing protein [bacterium]|nr:nucleotidyltransferase domain-containing protein [bacterium]